MTTKQTIVFESVPKFIQWLMDNPYIELYDDLGQAWTYKKNRDTLYQTFRNNATTYFRLDIIGKTLTYDVELRELVYVPYTKADSMWLGKAVKHKDTNLIFQITGIEEGHKEPILFGQDNEWISLKKLFNHWLWYNVETGETSACGEVQS